MPAGLDLLPLDTDVRRAIQDAKRAVSQAVPPGVMFDYAATTAPVGFVLCDGSSYNVADPVYRNLFSAIGYTWGGAGATFKVPDFRGRVSVGTGTGTGLTARTLAASGGEETHLLTAAESGMPAHSHTANTGTGAGYLEAGAGGTFNLGSANVTTGGGGYGINSNTANATAVNASAAHNVMQPFLVATKIIKL